MVRHDNLGPPVPFYLFSYDRVHCDSAGEYDPRPTWIVAELRLFGPWVCGICDKTTITDLEKRQVI